MSKKKSFFERLTGGVKMEDEQEEGAEEVFEKKFPIKRDDWSGDGQEEENEDAQLAVDVHQTPAEIIIQTMVAGVKPEDLNVSITRDMVTIKGKREGARNISDENFFVKELYWGSFSRTILLPQEIEPEEAEASEKHGLLVIKLPKIDKDKKTTLKIRAS